MIERGAGAEAQFPDAAYEKAGATMVDVTQVWAESDIMLKVRAPTEGGEIQKFKKGATSISFVYPRQNESVVKALKEAGVTSFAMDMIPRISRAQVFDALR